MALNCKFSNALQFFWDIYQCILPSLNQHSQIIQGIDQIRPGLGGQVQKPLLQSTNQFQLLPQQQQQQLLAQVQAQGNIGSSPMYADMDPQRLRGLARGSLNAKDGQPIANDGSIGSPMQSTSSKVLFVLFTWLSCYMKWENLCQRVNLHV